MKLDRKIHRRIWSNMNRNQELFEKAPVSKAVAVMAIPTMISMLVVVIYNMADTFFIGQTNDPMKVAAVSLATPIFILEPCYGEWLKPFGLKYLSQSPLQATFLSHDHKSFEIAS